MAFASNKNAYGICDITGFRYKHKDMKKTWDGLLVGKDQWDPKDTNNFFTVYTNVGLGKLGTQLTSYEIVSAVGSVTIITT